MHHLQTILIFKDIQNEDYLFGVYSQSLAPKNWISTQKFPSRQKMWVLTTLCQPSAGPDISLRHKGEMSRIIACTRRTGFQLFWRSMWRTNHINIWYFLITDKVKNGEVSVFWCPTGDMIGDCIIKNIQGDISKMFRYKIMGVILAADSGPGKVKV